MDAFKQILDVIFDYLHKHWIEFVTAAAFMVVGWYFGKRRARADWKKKEFLDRLNVSLNLISDGRLFIRTIIEKSCADVFLNSVAVDAVTSAARQTTPTDPILPLPKDDYWYYLNAVLNEVAEKFALGQVKRDLGANVVREPFVICLTNERAGEVRTHKIRAMLIKKKTLEGLPEKQPVLESPHHITRWETLKILATAYKTSPYKFLELEICV